jgi:hypothetical protein
MDTPGNVARLPGDKVNDSILVRDSGKCCSDEQCASFNCVNNEFCFTGVVSGRCQEGPVVGNNQKIGTDGGFKCLPSASAKGHTARFVAARNFGDNVACYYMTDESDKRDWYIRAWGGDFTSMGNVVVRGSAWGQPMKRTEKVWDDAYYLPDDAYPTNQDFCYSDESSDCSWTYASTR